MKNATSRQAMLTVAKETRNPRGSRDVAFLIILNGFFKCFKVFKFA